MTTREFIQLDFIFLLLVGTVGGSMYAYFSTLRSDAHVVYTLPIVQEFTSFQQASPTPTSTPLPQVATSSQLSPDGTKNVLLKVTTNADQTKTYDVVTTDANNTHSQTIYTTTRPSTDTIDIPFNTWSPNDAYLYLDNTTASGSGALVFRADGQPFGTSDPLINIAQSFAQKVTANIYQTTTGWASDTLLIVNSTSPTGDKGPSYWFDVPSQTTIQLYTKF